MDKYDSIIIGAGLAGLFLGRELKSRGENVLILEKSKGLGGRIATRRIENLGFDHGAPKLDLSPADKKFLGLNDEGYLMGGMTNLAKKMALDLPIKKETRVMSIHKKSDFELQTDQGDVFHSQKIYLTAPLPQALELLSQSELKSLIPDELKSIEYHKAVMALFTYEGALSSSPEIQAQKPRGLHPEGYILTLGSEESDQWFDHSEEEQSLYLKEKIAGLGSGKIRSFEVKKWRYTVVKKPLDKKFAELTKNLYLVGDAFGGCPLTSARSALSVS